MKFSYKLMFGCSLLDKKSTRKIVII